MSLGVLATTPHARCTRRDYPTNRLLHRALLVVRCVGALWVDAKFRVRVCAPPSPSRCWRAGSVPSYLRISVTIKCPMARSSPCPGAYRIPHAAYRIPCIQANPTNTHTAYRMPCIHANPTNTFRFRERAVIPLFNASHTKRRTRRGQSSERSYILH